MIAVLPLRKRWSRTRWIPWLWVMIGATITGSIYLSATQVTNPTTLPTPSCGWVCNCPGTSPSTVQVITNSAVDQLPVELMDFAVEFEAFAPAQPSSRDTLAFERPRDVCPVPEQVLAIDERNGDRLGRTAGGTGDCGPATG